MLETTMLYKRKIKCISVNITLNIKKIDLYVEKIIDFIDFRIGSRPKYLHGTFKSIKKNILHNFCE